jgi:hypothetical protein
MSSLDGATWIAPPVTGQMTPSVCGLVLSELQTVAQEEVDLWDYCDARSRGSPVRMRLGSSIVCCVRQSTELSPSKLKNNRRRIFACASLVPVPKNLNKVA